MNADFERLWLGDLPADWLEVRADFLCNAYRTTVSPTIYDDDLVAHYSIPHVQETGGPKIEPASDIDSSKLLITEPTLLVSKLNPRKKTICLAEPHSEYPTLASGEFVPVCSEEIDRGYAYYLWCSEKVTDRLSAIVQSVTKSHQRVNPADIRKLPWKWPPLDTQKRIAQFLDEKTAKIDGLIEKKRELLDRLAEKRQALITQAVTKGLNPDAPMKPSGIEWLGDIPEHWEIKSLKRLKQYLTSGSRDWAAFYADEGDVFLRMTNVTKYGIELDTEDLRYVDIGATNEGTRTATKKGDILITITAELGSVAIVREQFEGAYINQHIALFRPLQNLVDSEFLVNFLSTEMCRSQFTISGQGGTKQGLGFEQVNNVIVGLPRKDEQREIARYCGEIWTKFALTEKSVSRSIDRLNDYRSALITSAVTGQIEGLK